MIKKDVLETEVRTAGFKKVQDDILQTTKRIEDYRDSIKKLEAQKNRLVSAGKQESTEYKNTVKEINKLKDVVKSEVKTYDDLVKNLSICDMSYNQVKKRAAELAKQLKATSQSTEPQKYAELEAAHKRCVDQLKKMSAGIRKVNLDVEKVPSVWNNAFSKIKEFGPAIAIGKAFEWATSKMRSFISESVPKFREFDEALTDAMKTTGLSKDEIKDVSAELAKIDTRTAQNELLGLARVAGKLGLDAPKDVEGFVRAADMINVALSEDLGGNAEQAINEIGKLVDIFKLEDKFGIEDAMIRVGSTINSLGAASTANEGFIVDFTKRLAGTAPNAKIAIENVLGLAAGLDKLGQRSEASSTVISQVISKMFTKPAMFAKLAGLEVKAFTEILTTDANAAFISVLKGVQGNDAAMMDIANNLDDMEVRGARGKEVIGALAKDVSVLETQQLLANKAFAEGTSVIDEYVTKNSSAEAQSEKITKQFTEQAVILGEKLAPVVNSASTGLLYFTKAMVSVIGYLIESKGAIFAITGAYVLYNVQKKLTLFYSTANGIATLREVSASVAHTVATKAGTVAIGTYTLAQKALIAIKALLIGQFKAAGVAAKSFFVSLGPIGWAVTAVTALVGAMSLFGRKTKEASTETAKMVLELNQEKATYQDLVDAVNKSKEGTQERADLIKLINERYPDYLNSLLTEKSSTQEIVTALKEANSKMEENIKLKLQMAQSQAIAQQQLAIESDYVAKLTAEYNSSGDKTPQQMALFISYATKIVEKAREGKATMEDARNVLIALGQDKDRVMSVDPSAFNSLSIALNFGYQSLLRIQNAAQNAVHAKQTLNLLIGDPGVGGAGDGVKCAACGKSPCECKCAKCGKKPCGCKEGDKNKQKWALESDEAFAAKRIAMKKQRLDGEIATDEEYNKQLLALEVASLEARIATGKEKGADMTKLKEQLLDKQLSQANAAKKREESLLRASEDGTDGVAKLRREYDDKLRELGLYGKAVADMTTAEKAALLQIEKQYNTKLSSARLDALNKEMAKQKQLLDRKLANLRSAQNDELAEADTLEKKRALLTKLYGDKRLGVVTSEEQALKLIRAKYATKNEIETKANLEAMLKIYQETADEMAANGGLLDGVMISEEDQQKYLDIIAKLKEELAVLTGKSTTDPAKNDKKADILGMTADDWSTLFKNTEDGKTAFDKIAIAAQAIGAAMGDVFNLMAALEEGEFKKFEKSQNSKKKLLDRQLKSGQISQEHYSDKVQKLDEETDAKREEMERKQAERQKAMAIFNAIVSTAVAVVGALGSAPFGPWNIALAAVIGALGAVQIAAIAAQPLPGAAEGGMLVERAQDGKRYNALYEPQRRGEVSRPTVIVGEDGSEYVVPADGYSNPTIRPVLDMIEQARRQGQLKQLNLSALMMANMSISGRVTGGYVAQSTPSSALPKLNANDIQLGDSEMKSILLTLNAVLGKLDGRLEHPLSATVAITGKGGFEEVYNGYKKTKSRTTIGG